METEATTEAPQQMTHHEYCEYVLSVLEEHVYPRMKEGIDPIEVITTMYHQMDTNLQGLRMRIPLMVSMLKIEANTKGRMTMTSKVPGGSPTASVKREFHLKRQLSKSDTYDAFACMAEVCTHMMQNRVWPSELYEYSEYHQWDDDADDGTYLFSWPVSPWGLRRNE